MKYLITYDIARDGVRQRVHNLLASCGTRIQRSVWVCDLADNDAVSTIHDTIFALVTHDHDVVHVLPLTAAIIQTMTTMGQAPALDQPSYWYVP